MSGRSRRLARVVRPEAGNRFLLRRERVHHVVDLQRLSPERGPALFRIGRMVTGSARRSIGDRKRPVRSPVRLERRRGTRAESAPRGPARPEVRTAGSFGDSLRGRRLPATMRRSQRPRRDHAAASEPGRAGQGTREAALEVCFQRVERVPLCGSGRWDEASEARRQRGVGHRLPVVGLPAITRQAVEIGNTRPSER